MLNFEAVLKNALDMRPGTAITAGQVKQDFELDRRLDYPRHPFTRACAGKPICPYRHSLASCRPEALESRRPAPNVIFELRRLAACGARADLEARRQRAHAAPRLGEGGCAHWLGIAVGRPSPQGGGGYKDYCAR